MNKPVLLLIAAVAFAAPALAEDALPAAAAVTAPTAQGDAAADTSYLDQVVCKKLPPPTGTRLGARKVCQTERQWRELTRRSQEDVSKRQGGASFAGPGAGG